MTTGETTEIKNCYNQLCVWQGCLMPESENPIEVFTEFFKDVLHVRVKFCEQVWTNPNIDENGNPIEGTGGRSDLLFYIHDEDIPKFATKRLEYDIRWWGGDVVFNNKGGYLYSQEVLDKYLPIKW